MTSRTSINGEFKDSVREYLQHISENGNFTEQLQSSLFADVDYAAIVFDGFARWARANNKLGFDDKEKHLDFSSIPISFLLEG